MNRRYETEAKIEEKITELIKTFDECIDFFERDFAKRWNEKLYYSTEITERVREAQSKEKYSDLICDTSFLRQVYDCVKSWMGRAGPKMVEFENFSKQVLAIKTGIVDLSNYRWICSLKQNEWNDIRQKIGRCLIYEILPPDKSAPLKIFKLRPMKGKGESQLGSQLVCLSKVLYHLLPDLIPPIDREHTLSFFNWKSWQPFREPDMFLYILDKFWEIYTRAKFAEENWQRWGVSIPKAIDNAIIGFEIKRKGSSIQEVVKT